MMKKLLALALVLWVLCASGCAETLMSWSADFDGDGTEEQFVIDGEQKTLYAAGDLLYVDDGKTETVMKNAGFSLEDCSVWQLEDAVLFKIEVSYGIGGSTSAVFAVVEGKVEELPGMFSKLTQIDGNEFYYMQMDTDRNTDRSGQTEKPYYVHWQDGYFMEHGGIYVTEDDLAQWETGSDALEWIYRSGYNVKTILYRENGVVNISYSDNLVNGNLSLQFIDGELCMLNTRMKPTDMPEDCDYGGTYQTMTGNTRYVTFADAFPLPE